MLIPRFLTQTVIDKITASDKAVIIYGARQVGKTTLVNEIIRKIKLKTLSVNADQSKHYDILSSQDLTKLRNFTAGYKLLFIDEAQRIPEIGLNLKIIIDNLKQLKVIVTGSSSLDLASKISEPLTGRAWTYKLFPISFLELSGIKNMFELESELEERLIYGSFPEQFSISGYGNKREYLQNLSDSYLYKDLLELGGLRNSAKIRDLLKLLAFQIGREVSLTEIGSSLAMGKDTVARYIDFLEKSFILFRLKGFSRNLRKEVSKMDKIYFYDLGVRNIVIDNMKALSQRNDLGQLWENFLICERMKYLSYKLKNASTYYWRIYTGAELDYVEERGGNLYGYEIKHGKKTAKPPPGWKKAYPEANYSYVNRDNFLPFIIGK